MKLGLSIGYSRAQFEIPVQLVQRAEELGYDSVWTAEAYGTDAVTPLAYLAAVTKRIKLGTGIMQLAARTPANAAMCAATVDAMAGCPWDSCQAHCPNTCRGSRKVFGAPAMERAYAISRSRRRCMSRSTTT